MTESGKNREKIKGLFSKEYSKMKNYVRKHISDYEDIEPDDIIQEVAVSIFSKIDIESTIENAVGFFYRSIRNKIIDYYRTKKKKESIDRDESFLELRSEEMNPQETMEDYELQEELSEAIDSLKEDYRQVIIATEFEKRSFDELSKEWEIPIGTLLSRKHRAMANLQKILLEEN